MQVERRPVGPGLVTRERLAPQCEDLILARSIGNEHPQGHDIHYRLKAPTGPAFCLPKRVLEDPRRPGGLPHESPYAPPREVAAVAVRRLRIWFITSEARKGLRSTGKLCSSQIGRAHV